MLAVLLCGALSLSGDAWSQASGGPYAIPRQSIDGGAASAASTTYSLRGTLGQTEAGATASGAVYAVRGGFHAVPVAPQPDSLFSDGFEPAAPLSARNEGAR